MERYEKGKRGGGGGGGVNYCFPLLTKLLVILHERGPLSMQGEVAGSLFFSLCVVVLAR